jgi:hypothetical protein
MVLQSLRKEVTEMLKKRIIAVITGVALLLAVAGASGIALDSLGLDVTMPVSACQNGGSSGGGC